MQKKDFSEVKRALKPKFGNIKDIWATYANLEKNILFSSKKSMFSLSEDEQLVYSNLFSKILSGKVDKNLFLFSMDGEENQSELIQQSLYKISKNNEDKVVEGVMNKIIQQYDAHDNFAVLIATVSYEIPSYASDGTKLDDSDGLYQFMICAICPTKLEKPSVVYRHNKDFFEKAHRDFVLQAPEIGLLYPVFENREPNANKLLYFAKKSKKDSDLHPELLEDLFNFTLPKNGEVQMLDFAEKVSESFEGNKNISKLYDVKQSIEEKRQSLVLSGEEPTLTKEDVNEILTSHGGKQVVLDDDVRLDVVIPDKLIISGDTGLKINLTPEDMQTLLQKDIDGTNYLLIPTKDLDFNGIDLN